MAALKGLLHSMLMEGFRKVEVKMGKTNYQKQHGVHYAFYCWPDAPASGLAIPLNQLRPGPLRQPD